jgi:hypothetical protein
VRIRTIEDVDKLISFIGWDHRNVTGVTSSRERSG